MLVLDPQKGTASQAETSRESAPYTMTERSIEVRSEVERGEVGIGAPFYRREKLRASVLGDGPLTFGVAQVRGSPHVAVAAGTGERRPCWRCSKGRLWSLLVLP